ncbi:ferric iron uptake transcriptional regulator [Wenzhouxiangella sp. AB-CW3]|uniref:ferric iron uptake transcriptional regulator n=1 Tax=Wenzhouxiangella sp. AB-CW3 TaxID=2771012 RepID=UPI00168A94E1|nr:ferric iron uptake transcriptional regulator [Wenzhouxiangella sp. AB-CW3]QOC23712.1 ferric iron uptake transcriptional regulator [Wenzhouxiangella sp. AB-CW3]
MAEESSELRKAGLKVTHPRLQILRLLETTDQKHMTADEIYRALVDQGEEIGLATVYRVLSQFEAARLVRKHMFDGGTGRAQQACYEIDEEDHDHMVCVETGEVVEFHDEAIEQRQEEIAAQHGFEIVDHSLVLYVRPKRG